MYNKIFSKILDSSIWLEPTPTRVVWVMFIAVMDEHGFVQFASVANVAHRARVTIEEAEEAMRCLEGPDKNSSNPDHGGRRVERVPGGWMVFNAKAHRDLVTKVIIQEQTRLRVEKHRKKAKAERDDNGVPRDDNGNAAVTDDNEKLTPSVVVAGKAAKSVVVKKVRENRGLLGGPHTPPPQPPAAVAEQADPHPPRAPIPFAVTPTITRFMARFYAGKTPDRRADVARQMGGSLLAAGVDYKDNLVRAVDAEHLDECCREVMEEPPRDSNAAWMFVLAKLNDSYLEVLSARRKATEPPSETRSRNPDGLAGDRPAGASPIRAALAGVLEGLETARETGEPDDVE